MEQRDTPYDHPELSVVTAAFNEAENLPELVREVGSVLDSLHVDWEFLICDDGSSDETWEVVRTLHATDVRIRGVRLSRNFGKQAAMFAGLQTAAGDAVICLDADHQHPPALLPSLIAEWRGGAQVVETERTYPSSVPWLTRTASRVFSRLLQFLQGDPDRHATSDYFLVDRTALNEILRLSEGSMFVRSVVKWVGFERRLVPYVAKPRRSGATKFTFRKLTSLSLAGITSNSIMPLRIASALGILTSFVAFSELLFALFSYFVLERRMPGWTSIVSLNAFLFGVLFLLVGILGEYVGRILIEVRKRPPFLIRDRL